MEGSWNSSLITEITFNKAPLIINYVEDDLKNIPGVSIFKKGFIPAEKDLHLVQCGTPDLSDPLACHVVFHGQVVQRVYLLSA